MLKEIIITDLTRFKNQNINCIAGIDIETGECIRPKPYLTKEKIQELGLKIGSRVVGNFTRCYPVDKPHVEDNLYGVLKRIEELEIEDFFKVLDKNSVGSINEGFGVVVNGKKILEGNEPKKSIITLKIFSELLEVIRDSYGKIRVNLEDMVGSKYPLLALTESKNYERIEKYGSVEHINGELLASEYVYLRIGVSRLYQGAYWLQVNGIYCDIEI